MLRSINFGVSFWLARRSIPVQLIDGTITSLAGDQLTVAVDQAKVPTGITEVDLVVGDRQYRLELDATAKRYVADIIMPPVGRYNAIVEKRTEAGVYSSFSFTLDSLPAGQVIARPGGNPLPKTTVSLLLPDGNLWPASLYGQQNPLVTTDNGAYGFVVPNGSYTLLINRDGFREQRLEVEAKQNVVALAAYLAELGTAYEYLAIASDVVNEGQKQVMKGVKAVEKFAANPEVQRVVKTEVAPSVTSVAVVTVVPSLWSTLGPLLRYLFFQPLLVLGKRKRKKWGMVYNSLDKLPIGLTIVRLINMKTGKIIQSRVTDLHGRYIFFPEIGNYTITAMKPGFQYPSVILAGAKTDGRLVDIYHGEEVNIPEEGVPITPNIPLDPQAVDRPPRRLVWEKRLRIVQHVVSLTGVTMTAVSFAMTRAPLVGVYLVIHIGLYLLFMRFIRPTTPKRWGIILDARTGKPLEHAIVRLFTTQYNKLVSMQVTGGKGRYAFLVGPNNYYVTAEYPGYTRGQSQELQMMEVEKGFVNADLQLEKSFGGSEPPPPPISPPPNLSPPAPPPPPAA